MAYQNIIAVNTMLVDQSIYGRNAVLPYTLTVLRTIIPETQNFFYCFLSDVLVWAMSAQGYFADSDHDFINQRISLLCQNKS